MTTQQAYVAAPGLASVIMVLGLFTVLARRDKNIPIFDLGMLCAVITLIYTVYPLLNYWANDFSFGVLGDSRLTQYDPTPQDMGLFHLRHALYLFCFTTFYAAFRHRGLLKTGNVNPPLLAARTAIAAVFLVLTAYFLILRMSTGIDFHPSYEADAFEASFVARASAPIIVQQVSGKLAGILFVFKLALLCIVVSRCAQKKWLAVLLLWITVETAHAVTLGGARGGMMIFLMATVLLYHRLVKPLSLSFLIALGAALFMFFMFMGIYRSSADFSSMLSDYAQLDGGFLSGHNEFQSILGTSYDVLQRKNSGTELPWYLYITDFISLLPPQQLLPFEKVDASEWYLREIGLSQTGQGYMWGVVTQSIVGLDWAELAFRGAVLGYVLARIHNWYIRRQYDFYGTLLYLYLLLNIYNTFRNTSGSLLTPIIWDFVPAYLLIRIGATVFPVRKTTAETSCPRKSGF